MSSWVSKRWSAVLVCGAALVLLASCGQREQPAMTTYVMANGVEMTGEETTYIAEDGCAVSVYLQQIKGLADTELEQRINTRITDTVEELLAAEVPAYRGIRVLLPESADLAAQRVNVSVYGSFNNILSVSVERDMRFAVPGEENERYVGQIRTLNLDLNTGRDITLAELFGEQTDYLALLDGEVRRQLDAAQATEEGWYGQSWLKLAEPFTGLRAEQKFLVTPNGLYLCLDEETPEFAQEFYPSMLTINNDVLWQEGPFAQRFYQEGQNIDTAAAPMTPQLLGWPMEADRGQERSDTSDEYCSVYVRTQYSSRLPQVLQEQIEALASVDEAVLDVIKARTGAERHGYYELMVSADLCGDFCTLVRHENGYADGLEIFRVTNDVYTADTGEAVTLAQLFNGGYDYRSVIVEAIRQACSERHEDADAEALYAQMSWGVAAEGLRVNIAVSEEQTDTVFIPYAQFGQENMTIFH